jgi:hypothetical protein
MKIRIQVAIDAEDGDGEKVEDIVQLERGALRPEELGLTRAEAKAILRGMQQSLVTEQVAAYLTQFKICPDCSAPHPQGAPSHRLSNPVRQMQSPEPAALRLCLSQQWPA